jgi:methylamine dehydrogenase accessory protein MauD
MDGIWMVSYLALWVVVVFLILTMLVLARQVGLLHRRIAPSVARMENDGPAIGEVMPELNEMDIQGREVHLGAEMGRQTLMLFMSSRCPACQELAPAVRSIASSERRNLSVLMVTMDRDEAANRDFVAKNKLGHIPLIVSEELATLYSVFSPPYGVLIDENRVVKAKGLINQIEHLESLLNAAQMGHASMEQWISRQSDETKRALGTMAGSQQEVEKPIVQ